MELLPKHNGAAIGYGQLIRGNRNFRWLWFGQIVSLLGDWFHLIASASLIAVLTQSKLAAGNLFIVRMLAPFGVSPIAGVIADRYNRKRILILSDIARSITVVGFLFVRDVIDVWLLYTLTAIQFGINGFFSLRGTRCCRILSRRGNGQRPKFRHLVGDARHRGQQ